MKNKIILLFIAAFLAANLNSFSQQNNSREDFIISNISTNGFNLEIKVNDISFIKQKHNNDNYFSIEVDGYGKSLEIGEPLLPVYKKLFELPEGANYWIEVISEDTKIIDLSNEGIYDLLIPSQASVLKIENPDTKFAINKNIYKSDSYYSLDLAKIIPLGKMRATSLARLEISPIAYNPISNTLKITNNIKLRIHITNYNSIELNNNKQRFYSPDFNIKNKMLLNGNIYNASKVSTYNQFPYKYVIVADSMFKESLQPFVRWKEKKGFKVIEAYLQDPLVGSTKDSIKTYLQGLYNAATVSDPAPTYVLFVGDVAQLPSWSGTTGGSHVTDLHYCEYTGDFFPEMMYGRFSANDTSELNPQIEKTIDYEMYNIPDPSYLGNSVLISGYDGSGHAPTYGDGQVNYGVAEYFNSSNSTNCSSYLYVNNSYSKDNEIFQKIDSGVSIANYTAHGAIDGWADPVFKVANIANMTNKDKYPLMIGNACITNYFNASVCFGEGLMRARNKGAIGYIGASDNTYWDEDYYWAVGYGAITSNPTYASLGPGLYDKMFHTHNEPFPDWSMSSFQYIIAGNLAVTQGGSYSNYYFEVYHIMGDPSLMAYQRVPSQITANNLPFISAGTTTFQVNTVPHALVALSQNDTLITSIMSDANGIATLQLGNSFNVTGSIDLIITAQNYAPYFNTVVGGPPTGPYVISAKYILDDSISNNNSFAEYGDSIYLDVDFTNLTSFLSVNANAVIQTNDTLVTILNNSCSLGNIQAYDTVNYNNAFKILIDSAAIDMHDIHFDIIVTDNGGTPWTSSLIIPVFAPNLVIDQAILKDTIQANSNGIIEAGESVIIKIKLMNNGSRDAINVVCNYISSNNLVLVNNSVTIDTLKAGSYKWLDFNVSFDQSMTNGDYANILFEYKTGAYNGSENFAQVIGRFDEDFETGDFSLFTWDTTFNNSWIIDNDTNNIFEGDFSMRSKKSLLNDEKSEISISMTTLADDSISYYSKISCEPGYDNLYFYIDGNQMGKWSGNKNWKKYSFFVEAGEHTFSWKYEKDYYQAQYLDAIWVDYISFPPTDTWSNIEYNEEKNISQISIWPNPASDNINIEMNLQKDMQLSVSIINQLGQKVIDDINYGKQFSGKANFSINTTGLQSGVYIVRISSGKQQYYQKLIIK